MSGNKQSQTVSEPNTTDTDRLEASPSTGWREVAVLMDVAPGLAVIL